MNDFMASRVHSPSDFRYPSNYIGEMIERWDAIRRIQRWSLSCRYMLYRRIRYVIGLFPALDPGGLDKINRKLLLRIEVPSEWPIGRVAINLTPLKRWSSPT